MFRAKAVVGLVVGVLVLALCACTTAVPLVPGPPAARPAALAAEVPSEIGNDHPQISFVGSIVRRRVVVVIHSQEGADLAAIRLGLEKVAISQQLALSDISPVVLDPALLEHLVRPVIVSLPEGSTFLDAKALTDPKHYPTGGLPGAEHVHIVRVQVHDLTFSVHSTDSKALAEAIAREGILADALGNYGAVAAAGVLTIGYTGPLLHDDLIESIRAAIGRQAGVEAAAVTLAPRSSAGSWVDMLTEPAPLPENTGAVRPHRHSGDH